jgi:O-acetyl-ADP-ribose deacetylase (regulator of RNase III)
MISNIRILEDNIVNMKVDAIVNAANRALCGGGGVDGAIHKAAGKALLEECRTLGGCETGKAKITKGYALPAKYIIHTVGPVWYGGQHGEEAALESCYVESLKLAEQYGVSSIAFPAIGTGAYRFPVKKASDIAIRTISLFLNSSSRVKEVLLVCFESKMARHLNTALNKLRDER